MGYPGIIHRCYRDAMPGFVDWHRTTYGEAPNAQLLTAREIQEREAHRISALCSAGRIQPTLPLQRGERSADGLGGIAGL